MDKKKKKKSIEKEIPENQYEQIALGRECFICGKIFTKESIDESSKITRTGLKDIPVRANNIPGFMHKRCRAEYSGNIILNPIGSQDITNEMRNLLDKKN